MDERDAIVAWALRERIAESKGGGPWAMGWNAAMVFAAAAIERGDHLKDKSE